MEEDQNCLSWWLPRLQEAGILTPRTEIVRWPGNPWALADLCDGKTTPEGCQPFLASLEAACERIGSGPWFLRTGHGSGKHDWRRTCYLTDRAFLGHHVAALVEWSHCVDMMGLPHDVWAVREMLPTVPAFWLPRYNGMPVNREFRFFLCDGKVEHVQSYWPEGAVEEGGPIGSDWRERLAKISVLSPAEREYLTRESERAAVVLPGYWSLDWLQAADGNWFAIDAALGVRSFRYGG